MFQIMTTTGTLLSHSLVLWAISSIRVEGDYEVVEHPGLPSNKKGAEIGRRITTGRALRIEVEITRAGDKIEVRIREGIREFGFLVHEVVECQKGALQRNNGARSKRSERAVDNGKVNRTNRQMVIKTSKLRGGILKTNNKKYKVAQNNTTKEIGSWRDKREEEVCIRGSRVELRLHLTSFSRRKFSVRIY